MRQKYFRDRRFDNYEVQRLVFAEAKNASSCDLRLIMHLHYYFLQTIFGTDYFLQ